MSQAVHAHPSMLWGSLNQSMEKRIKRHTATSLHTYVHQTHRVLLQSACRSPQLYLRAWPHAYLHAALLGLMQPAPAAHTLTHRAATAVNQRLPSGTLQPTCLQHLHAYNLVRWQLQQLLCSTLRCCIATVVHDTHTHTTAMQPSAHPPLLRQARLTPPLPCCSR